MPSPRRAVGSGTLVLSPLSMKFKAEVGSCCSQILWERHGIAGGNNLKHYQRRNSIPMPFLIIPPFYSH